MKNFNWEEFKRGNIAVHCDTEAKAKDFLEKCDTKGIKFKARNRTTEGTNSWKWYKEQTIYCINNNKLLYSSYLERRARRAIGYKIIEWEIDTMKELTFTEVIANIKEDEVWESYYVAIYKKNGGISISFKEGKSYSMHTFSCSTKYKLQRKEYTFQEAFKAYEEGKEIEYCNGTKYKKIDNEDHYKGEYDVRFCSKSCEYDYWFGFDEVRGAWYIND